MEFEELREEMVREQIFKRGITDERVLEAMRKVPREDFLPPDNKKLAYEDGAVPIGSGQTMSQPYMVGLMTAALHLQPQDQVLEIGTGSGYQTAILAEMCREVYSIERIAPLAEKAKNILDRLEYANIHVEVGDGTLGWPSEDLFFDAILIAAGGPRRVEPLIGQLKEGGRMVFPLGERQQQTLMRLSKRRGQLQTEELCRCVFVPLVGEYGWTN